METVFGTAFEYKLIYVFAINDEAHNGLLKIGDTTIQSDDSIDALFPNCKALNQAALSLSLIHIWRTWARKPI